MSASAESNGTVNGHANGTALLDRVRQELEYAAENDLPEPGRNALARKLGVKPHHVRQAKLLLSRQPATPAPAPAMTVGEFASPEAAQADAGEDLADQSHQVGATPPPMAPTLQKGARFVAWLGFAFGSVMSVAANVLHTWLPADQHPPGWAPALAPQIGAAVWPIGLLISVEVLSRVAWRQGPLWGLARYGGAGTVAIGSGVISYGHLREVLLAWGYGHPGADVGPLVLDGLMVVCGFALLSMTARQGGASQ